MKINNKIKSLFLLSLVGSGLTKEENSKNQSEINLNSLPQMAVNLTEREDNPNQILFFAGMPISFIDQIGAQGRCVASFAIVPSENHCTWELGGTGFLTSALCCKRDGGCNEPPNSVLLVEDNPQEIGYVGDTAFTNYDYPRTDFGFVSTYNDLQLVPYVAGDKDLLPVTGLGSATLGTKVCAHGTFTGYLCGNVVDMDLSMWTDTGLGSYFFKGLNKVDLGDYGFDYGNDLGAPVYVESNIGDRTVAQALGYITKVDNNDQHHQFLYYTPIDKALEELAAKNNCYYTLMTYNETNAQEYQELLAQIEIPPKK